MKRLLEIINIIKITEIQSEKPKEIIVAVGWMTMLSYGLALMVWILIALMLDGIQGQSKYEFNTSPFWADYVYTSFTALIMGTIVGLVGGIIHGGIISIVYHDRIDVASRPKVFKLTVYLSNLLLPSLFITFLLFDAIRHEYIHSPEQLGLLCLVTVVAAAYTSRQFWKWWIRDEGERKNQSAS